MLKAVSTGTKVCAHTKAVQLKLHCKLICTALAPFGQRLRKGAASQQPPVAVPALINARSGVLTQTSIAALLCVAPVQLAERSPLRME